VAVLRGSLKWGVKDGLIGDIAIASVEQKDGIVQIKDIMLQLDRMTQQNSSAAEELAASSTEMDDQAEKLNKMIEYFTVTEKPLSSSAVAVST
jgi:methyl-accepting chemotaxis protein